MDLITLADLVAEVDKTETFKGGLGEFLLLTTADRDSGLQAEVREHYRANPQTLHVEVVFWGDIVADLAQDEALVAKHWKGFSQGAPLAPGSPEPFEREISRWMTSLNERLPVWRAFGPNSGWFSTIFMPDTNLTTALADHKLLRSAVMSAQVTASSGLEYPCSNYSGHLSVIQNRHDVIEGSCSNREHQELWQLHTSGTFMYANLLRQDHDLRGTQSTDFESIIAYVGSSLLFAHHLYGALLRARNIHYKMLLSNVRGLRLVSSDPLNRPLSPNYRAGEDEVSVVGDVQVSDLRTTWRSLVKMIVKRMFVLFNWEIVDAAIEQRLDAYFGGTSFPSR
jgi:hypothetical protein